MEGIGFSDCVGLETRVLEFWVWGFKFVVSIIRFTLNPTRPYTLNPKPQTLDPKP